MIRKCIPLVVAATALSGCLASGNDQYFVGTQGSNNVYEFSITRFNDAVGAKSYAPQRDSLASRICPQGYRIIDEQADVSVRQAGVRQLSEYRIRIACPG